MGEIFLPKAKAASPEGEKDFSHRTVSPGLQVVKLLRCAFLLIKEKSTLCQCHYAEASADEI